MDFTFFWTGEPFSQWSAHGFVINGIRYTSAEQYMMARKAMMFDDELTLHRIMATANPYKQKMLGRQVKKFDTELWQKEAQLIVYRANFAKFTQNAHILPELMKTMGTTIVEASPYDKIWGIGLSADDPKALNRDTWQGLNWLGEVLTDLREDLHYSGIAEKIMQPTVYRHDLVV